MGAGRSQSRLAAPQDPKQDTEPKKSSDLTTKKSLTPALSKPGLSALFWSTVLSGAQIFLAHFLCPKPRPQYGRFSLTCWIFAPKKTKKGGISAARLLTR